MTGAQGIGQLVGKDHTMAKSLEFTTAARRREPIPFVLDDREYQFVPPKKAGMVMSVIDGDQNEAVALFDWLSNGLSKEDERSIEDRLRDPEDDFDIDDLMAIVKALLAQVSGRPTKPSSDSGRRR